MDETELRAGLADLTRLSFALSTDDKATLEDAYRQHIAKYFGVAAEEVEVVRTGAVLTARLPITEPIEINIATKPFGLSGNLHVWSDGLVVDTFREV